MASYDIIIKNGTVVDGTGNDSFKADVGVVGDKIKKIGDLSKESGIKIIDAENKIVAPGFIDLTCHSDVHWTIFTQPGQESLLQQGVTTIVGGNCGTSLAPFAPGVSDKEISRWVDPREINVNWRTMGEYLDEMEGRKFGVNFATFVGFNSLQAVCLGKLEVMGEQEVSQFKLVLKESLHNGAWGLSVNLGLPYAALPADSVLIDIFSAVKEFGALINHHLEDEGDNILPALSRVINLARRSGTRLHISHLKILGGKSWDFIPSAMKMMTAAINDGVDLTYDFFPYTKTGSSLVMFLPEWFRKLPMSDRKEILSGSNDEMRSEVVAHLKKITLHYEKMIVAASNDLMQVGKTVAELANGSELPEEEFILRLLEANDMRVSVFNESIMESSLEIIAGNKFAAISSDGVGYDFARGYDRHDMPHPRSFGAFPRFLNLFVKNKPILTWESAIYKASGLPAQILGLGDRGLVSVGKKADIVILNPLVISDDGDYRSPAKKVKGVDWVIVNGALAVENGETKNKSAGRVLRKGF